MVTIDADPTDLVEKTADSRGRITLGSDYAGENVKVLILDD